MAILATNTREVQPVEDLREMITGHRFFKDLDPAFLPFLKSAATFVEYGPKQVIFDESTKADSFHLIQWGCVGLETHIPGRHQVIVQRIGVGEALGWSWFFPPHSWRFTARTLDATEAIVFNAATLRDYADQNHDFGYDLAMRMGQLMRERLKATCSLLQDYCK